MFARMVAGGLVVALLAAVAQAQAPATAPPERTAGKWRSPAGMARRTSATQPLSGSTQAVDDGIAPLQPASSPAGGAALAPVDMRPRQPIAKVTEGPGRLPDDAGQVWRQYDISPYVVRQSGVSRPEQAILDWILRETGYEAWHSEPVGLLSANRRTLTAYHTPQVQAVVADIVDRFVNTETEANAFGLRVVTIGHPDWRIKAKPMLRPVAVQTQGIQAWLVAREDAALLMSELRKRNDFREHSSPNLVVKNGQSTIVSATRPRSYVRDVALRPDVWPAFEPELTTFDEGFGLELSPLLSLDGTSVDAVIKCNIDQLEKLFPVMLDVPTQVAPNQRTKVEVPQIIHCRLHERFRWPADHVLMVGLGVVATPVPSDPQPLRIPLPWTANPARADLLVIVESKGKTSEPGGAPPPATPREAKTYRGRY